MTYEELVQLAEGRMDYPEVADVVVSDRMFRVAQGCTREEAPLLARLKVYSSEFLMDGYILGRNHQGDVIRIWGPNGEQKLPAQEGILRIGWQARALVESAGAEREEGGG